jgi:hypothetical protein
LKSNQSTGQQEEPIRSGKGVCQNAQRLGNHLN